MPYTKIVTKSKPRRRFNRSRRLKRRPNIQSFIPRNIGNMSLRQAAYGAMKGVNMIRGLVNSELKRFDFQLNTTISSTPAFTSLAQIAESDDVNGRTGNSILAKYLACDYNISINSSATQTSVRVLCFVDTQFTGTAPTIADITAGNNITGFINADNTQRFTILFDDHIDLSVNGERLRTVKHYIPLNFHIRYTAASGSTINKNNIFLMTVSTEATNVPSMISDNRLAYYDN